ncbi:MAG: hypothetical protein HOW97_41185 [Catenulispora sp.]|nr:hypothetical protein [Catenulispora sp.]
MKRRSRTTLAVLAALSATAAGVFGGAGVSQAANSSKVSAAPFDSVLVRQNDQLIAIEHFRAIAAAAPDRFAGVSTQGSAHVTVNLAGDPAKSAADVGAIKREAAGVGITVSFPVRKYSLSDLASTQTLAAGDASLSAAASAPVSATIDPDTDSVQIVSTGVTDGLRARAHALFGDAVTVRGVSKLTMAQGRFDDSSPYWGGDRIGNTTGYCTYGFSLTNAYGTRYGITAGHCWGMGSGVDVTRQFGGTGNYGAGYASFGTVQVRRYGNNSLDAELIGGKDYGGEMWIGADLANDSSVFAPVHGAHASCNGCNVYFNGSFTGKSLATVDSSGPACYGIVEDTGGTVTTCGLWTAHSTNGQRICHGGDSGGPVFAYDGKGGVTAVGIIDACSTDGTVGVYTDIPQILSTWTSNITIS